MKFNAKVLGPYHMDNPLIYLRRLMMSQWIGASARSARLWTVWSHGAMQHRINPQTGREVLCWMNESRADQV